MECEAAVLRASTVRKSGDQSCSALSPSHQCWISAVGCCCRPRLGDNFFKSALRDLLNNLSSGDSRSCQVEDINHHDLEREFHVD